MCADEIPDRVCDVDFGSTQGCDCEGRALTETEYGIKSSEYSNTDRSAKNVACYMDGMQSVFQSLHAEAEDAKWMYYGSKDGVYVNYPGFLWERDLNGCGAT